MVGAAQSPPLTADEAGQLAMTQILLVGLGAGVAAGLMVAVMATGAIVAFVLYFLAPLPIMIAAIGWSHWSGLIAALFAALGLGMVLGFPFFLAFLIGFGLPAWWLGYLALLARPVGTNGAAQMEWYPPGRLLMWCALIGAALVLVAVP